HPDSIRVCPPPGNGKGAPIRVIKGPDTQLDDVESIAVDPINNIIVVAGARPAAAPGQTGSGGETEAGGGELILFRRPDNGNVKPLGIIGGPRTDIVRINQIQMQPTKG